MWAFDLLVFVLQGKEINWKPTLHIPWISSSIESVKLVLGFACVLKNGNKDKDQTF